MKKIIVSLLLLVCVSLFATQNMFNAYIVVDKDDTILLENAKVNTLVTITDSTVTINTLHRKLITLYRCDYYDSTFHILLNGTPDYPEYLAYDTYGYEAHMLCVPSLQYMPKGDIITDCNIGRNVVIFVQRVIVDKDTNMPIDDIIWFEKPNGNRKIFLNTDE